MKEKKLTLVLSTCIPCYAKNKVDFLRLAAISAFTSTMPNERM